MQPKKKVERLKTLGGSDAIRIMEGDWHTLWLEKTGRQEPANLIRCYLFNSALLQNN